MSSVYRVQGPTGMQTIKLDPSPTFGQLQGAIKTAFSLVDFEILYGFPISAVLSMDADSLLNSSQTYGALKLRLPIMPPPPAATAAAAPTSSSSASGAEGPLPGYSAEFWSELPLELREEIREEIREELLANLAEEDDEEDEEEETVPGPDHAALLAQYAKHMKDQQAGSAAAPPSSSAPSVPAQRGFGARIAGLGSTGTTSASAGTIGGGIRPGQVRIGRVQQEDDK